MELQFPFTISVTLLALLVYHWMGFKAGGARVKFKVDAPATEGPDDYRRFYRAHINTLEHLVSFVPAMWIFAVLISDMWAAALGLVWTIGRLFYALGYYKAAEKRMPGLMISFLAAVVLILGSVVSIVMDHI